MITSYLKKMRQKNLFVHGLILFPILVAQYLLRIVMPEYSLYIYLITLFLALVLLISLLVGIHKIKQSLTYKKVKINQVSHMIPYPQKFTDSMVEVGGFFKSYRYKKHMIPDYLIEFREGRMLYLYQMVHEANDECYTILRNNKFDIALVLDTQNKKRIIHLGNAVLVE